jgi:hypothetical protein
VYSFKQDFLVLNNTISQNFSLYTLFFHLFIFNLNFSLLNISRDFCFRVCYALLIPAQRVDHGRNTRGIRVDHGRNTRSKQTVINDVFNKRFKRFNFVMEHESNI